MPESRGPGGGPGRPGRHRPTAAGGDDAFDLAVRLGRRRALARRVAVLDAYGSARSEGRVPSFPIANGNYTSRGCAQIWGRSRTLTMPEPLSHTRAETSPSSAMLKVCEGRFEGFGQRRAKARGDAGGEEKRDTLAVFCVKREKRSGATDGDARACAVGETRGRESRPNTISARGTIACGGASDDVNLGSPAEAPRSPSRLP